MFIFKEEQSKKEPSFKLIDGDLHLVDSETGESIAPVIKHDDGAGFTFMSDNSVMVLTRRRDGNE